MKAIPTLFIAFLLAFSLAWMGDASATPAEDKAWTKKCIKDNADSGEKKSVITKYCTCMVDLMPEEETLSVTAWEKTHRKEMKICEKKAGWK
ncbi:hypothetical protein ACQZV8_09430 [Magnetococcales bacterium HHB-1]